MASLVLLSLSSSLSLVLVLDSEDWFSLNSSDSSVVVEGGHTEGLQVV